MSLENIREGTSAVLPVITKIEPMTVEEEAKSVNETPTPLSTPTFQGPVKMVLKDPKKKPSTIFQKKVKVIVIIGNMLGPVFQRNGLYGLARAYSFPFLVNFLLALGLLFRSLPR